MGPRRETGRVQIRLAAELDEQATELSAGAGNETSRVRMNTLKESLPKSVELLGDVLQNPAFRPGDVDRILVRTGAKQVAIVGHSEGGMMPRYYIKFLGGESKLDDWVSLGGPNHGTETANVCFSTSCVEMRIGSTFLKELNAGDETPGAVNYGTWWSPCDEIINPHTSVSLTGATNTETECISHAALTTNEKVFKGVREFVN